MGKLNAKLQKIVNDIKDNEEDLKTLKKIQKIIKGIKQSEEELAERGLMLIELAKEANNLSPRYGLVRADYADQIPWKHLIFLETLLPRLLRSNELLLKNFTKQFLETDLDELEVLIEHMVSTVQEKNAFLEKSKKELEEKVNQYGELTDKIQKLDTLLKKLNKNKRKLKSLFENKNDLNNNSKQAAFLTEFKELINALTESTSIDTAATAASVPGKQDFTTAELSSFFKINVDFDNTSLINASTLFTALEKLGYQQIDTLFSKKIDVIKKEKDELTRLVKSMDNTDSPLNELFKKLEENKEKLKKFFTKVRSLTTNSQASDSDKMLIDPNKASEIKQRRENALIKEFAEIIKVLTEKTTINGQTVGSFTTEELSEIFGDKINFEKPESLTLLAKLNTLNDKEINDIFSKKSEAIKKAIEDKEIESTSSKLSNLKRLSYYAFNLENINHINSVLTTFFDEFTKSNSKPLLLRYALSQLLLEIGECCKNIKLETKNIPYKLCAELRDRIMHQAIDDTAGQLKFSNFLNINTDSHENHAFNALIGGCINDLKSKLSPAILDLQQSQPKIETLTWENLPLLETYKKKEDESDLSKTFIYLHRFEQYFNNAAHRLKIELTNNSVQPIPVIEVISKPVIFEIRNLEITILDLKIEDEENKSRLHILEEITLKLDITINQINSFDKACSSMNKLLFMKDLASKFIYNYLGEILRVLNDKDEFKYEFNDVVSKQLKNNILLIIGKRNDLAHNFLIKKSVLSGNDIVELKTTIVPMLKVSLFNVKVFQAKLLYENYDEVDEQQLSTVHKQIHQQWDTPFNDLLPFLKNVSKLETLSLVDILSEAKKIKQKIKLSDSNIVYDFLKAAYLYSTHFDEAKTQLSTTIQRLKNLSITSSKLLHDLEELKKSFVQDDDNFKITLTYLNMLKEIIAAPNKDIDKLDLVVPNFNLKMILKKSIIEPPEILTKINTFLAKEIKLVEETYANNMQDIQKITLISKKLSDAQDAINFLHKKIKNLFKDDFDLLFDYLKNKQQDKAKIIAILKDCFSNPINIGNFNLLYVLFNKVNEVIKNAIQTTNNKISALESMKTNEPYKSDQYTIFCIDQFISLYKAELPKFEGIKNQITGFESLFDSELLKEAEPKISDEVFPKKPSAKLPGNTSSFIEVTQKNATIQATEADTSASSACPQPSTGPSKK